MLYDAFDFLITNIAGFFILNLLLRFYLQVVRAPFNHPLAQFTVKLTNFAVLPLRRLIPSVGGYDSATLLLAWLVALIMRVLITVIRYPLGLMSPAGALGFALLALVSVIQFSLYLLLGAVVLQAILSWVTPYNPLSPILNAMTKPFLGPIQRIFPPLNGIDLSPMVLALVLMMLQRFVMTTLDNEVFLFTLQHSL